MLKKNKNFLGTYCISLSTTEKSDSLMHQLHKKPECVVQLSTHYCYFPKRTQQNRANIKWKPKCLCGEKKNTQDQFMQ